MGGGTLFRLSPMAPYPITRSDRKRRPRLMPGTGRASCMCGRRQSAPHRQTSTTRGRGRRHHRSLLPSEARIDFPSQMQGSHCLRSRPRRATGEPACQVLCQGDAQRGAHTGEAGRRRGGRGSHYASSLLSFHDDETNPALLVEVN